MLLLRPSRLSRSPRTPMSFGRVGLALLVVSFGVLDARAVTAGIDDDDPVKRKNSDTTVRLVVDMPVDKGLCTGILLSPTAVLTAKHCVAGYVEPFFNGIQMAPVQPVRVIVGVGSHVDSSEPPRLFDSVGSPSLYYRNGPLLMPLEAGRDVAIVWLDPANPVLNGPVIPRQRLASPVPRGGDDAEGGDYDVPICFSGWGTVWGHGASIRQMACYPDVYHYPGLPDGGPGMPSGQYWVRAQGSGNLENGDSGGPLFWEQPDGSRQVLGVASLIVPGLFPEDLSCVFNKCDIWTDVTRGAIAAWIRGEMKDVSRTARWLELHGKGDDYWKGEVDYTGECDAKRDRDCDGWYDAHDDCPAQFNPQQMVGTRCDTLIPYTRHSGNFIQSARGLAGNFELLVPQGGRLLHFVRSNDDAGVPWQPGGGLASAPPMAVMGAPQGVSLIQTNIAPAGNLLAVARVASSQKRSVVGSTLVLYRFDANVGRWLGPFDVTVGPGQLIDRVTGDPALIERQVYWKGDELLLLVPRQDGIHCYWQSHLSGAGVAQGWGSGPSDDLGLGKEKCLPPLSAQIRRGVLPADPIGVAAAETDNRDWGIGGQGLARVIVVARMHPRGARRPSGDYVAEYEIDGPRVTYVAGPFPIVADGQGIDGVTGDPALIQGTRGSPGNLEMVVPQGNALVHYWRDNGAPGTPWHRGQTLPVPGARSTRKFDDGLLPTIPLDVAIFESDYPSSGPQVAGRSWSQGQLEVAVRLSLGATGGPMGTGVAFFRLDRPTNRWLGPFALEPDGKAVMGLTGF